MCWVKPARLGYRLSESAVRTRVGGEWVGQPKERSLVVKQRSGSAGLALHNHRYALIAASYHLMNSLERHDSAAINTCTCANLSDYYMALSLAESHQWAVNNCQRIGLQMCHHQVSLVVQ